MNETGAFEMCCSSLDSMLFGITSVSVKFIQIRVHFMNPIRVHRYGGVAAADDDDVSKHEVGSAFFVGITHDTDTTRTFMCVRLHVL